MRRKILVRSRHNTHANMRNLLPTLPFCSVVRLGSTTSIDEINTSRRQKKLVEIRNVIECNTIDAVKNSSNKLKMKECFTRDRVKTADWWKIFRQNDNLYNCENQITRINQQLQELPYPIVAKSHFGSRGQGNTLLNNQQELETWMRGKNLNSYIFEKYYNFLREYRLHIDDTECFYSCRKMLKRDAPEANKWQRHDDNCVWILENNPQFDKPSNWNEIVEHSIKALRAVGLDIGAVDVRVQSRLDSKGRVRENPEFIIVEINSAPSFGEITEEKYVQRIPLILNNKYANR